MLTTSYPAAEGSGGQSEHGMYEVTELVVHLLF